MIIKRLTGFGAALAATLAVSSLYAETQVGVSSVAVSATVTGVNSLTTDIRNISDDSEASAVAFGTVSSGGPAWGTLPNQYVRVRVQDNAASWRLRSYTDNFDSRPSTATWGLQYGGLKGASPGAKVPMGWMALPNTVPNGPGTGNPADGTSNGWTFLKDEHDVDDPATVGNDEGFPASDQAGYTNIAFGSPSFTRVVRPNISGGSEALGNPTDPFYWYVEGDFSSAPATTYSGNIVLELINQ
jgi:hypothetical protein